MAKYAQIHSINDTSSLCVLGFENGYYGNSIATLSCSDSRVNQSNVPTLDWPVAPFPQVHLPMDMFEHQNRQEEDRCLQAVRDIIKQRRDQKKDVAAIIVEPITYFNNQIATPYYFKRLRQIATENQVPFVVDETKTGMGITGKMWGYEHWNLTQAQAPDFVTFGGKSGISGFYSTIDYKLSDTGISFDQNVDMVKVLNYGITWQTIQRKDLLTLVNDTSSFLKIELNRASVSRGFIHNIRGNGTFIGFDCTSPEMADSLQRWFFRSGNYLLKCGPQTFGLRPALILGPKHAASLRESALNYHPNFNSA